ncbi:MAG: formate-dependent phosphoribosylglycinamide formyltransferase, partial [Myxococcota bacterium]
GELGKEVVIEAQRLGVEVIAVDRYADAPAMQVAHRAHVIDMQDPEALTALVEQEQPDLIVPEIEAIATDTLIELEAKGQHVIPTARATRLTMDREGIRKLAAEELGLPTSAYAFADSEQAFEDAVATIGLPCVVKPVMSSSGKGQSIVRTEPEAKDAWHTAIHMARGSSRRVIVEEFIDFDTEITLLTARHSGGTSFCDPIGHRQEHGDYRESWQPEHLSDEVVAEAQRQAKIITDELGGWGVFGVEFFISGHTVYFSELSPRPHDTGMVTMITQELSEFALHARAILGIPLPSSINRLCAGASTAILARDDGGAPTYTVDANLLAQPGTQLRLFGKPSTRPGRRMGVALARGTTAEQAREVANTLAKAVTIHHV